MSHSLHLLLLQFGPSSPPFRLFLVILLFHLASLAFGFSCFTCNTNADKDDTEPCSDKVDECREGSGNGIQSCSTLLYFSNRANPGAPHVRKFCTSPGLPLGSILERFPLKTSNGSGFCQSVDKWQIGQQSRMIPSSSLAAFSKVRRTIRRINRLKEGPIQPPSRGFILERRKRSQLGKEGASPPASPRSYSSTLLCICTQPLCNGGDFQDILSRQPFFGDIHNANDGILKAPGVVRKAKFEIEEETGEEEGENNNTPNDKEMPMPIRRKK